MDASNTEGVVSPSSQDLQTSGCTEVHRRRSARPTPSTFSTGTAQALGEHKGAPSAGQPRQSSAVTARVRNPDSSAPLLSPWVPAQPFQRSHSGPRRGGEEGLPPHAPFTQHKQPGPLRRDSRTRAAPAALLSPGLKARRAPADTAGPAGRSESAGRRSRCVRGITGPPALPPRPRLSSHTADGNEAAGTGPARGDAASREQPRPPHGASPPGPPSAPPRPPHCLPQQQPGPPCDTGRRPDTHPPPEHPGTHGHTPGRTRRHAQTDTDGQHGHARPGAGAAPCDSWRRVGRARRERAVANGHRAAGNGRPAAQEPRPPAPPPRDSLRRLWMSSEWLAPPDFQAIARHTLRSRYRAAFSAATAHSSFPRKDTTSSADTGAASSPPPPAAAAAAAAARSPRGGATRPPPRAPDMPRPPSPPLRRPARCPLRRACAPTAPRGTRGGSRTPGRGSTAAAPGPCILLPRPWIPRWWRDPGPALPSETAARRNGSGGTGM